MAAGLTPPDISPSALRAEFRARVLAYAGYDGSDYVALHPDLASVTPADHFLEYGLWEQRPAASPQRFATRLAEARLNAFPHQPLHLDDLEHQYQSVFNLTTSIHAPFLSSAVTAQIVDGIVNCLAFLGVKPELYLSPPCAGKAKSIAFDPSVLFGPVSSETAALELYRSCLLVTSKAPEDSGFAAELPFLLAAGAVAAFDADTFALMAAAGVPAAWLGLPVADALSQPVPAGSLAGLSRAAKTFNPTDPWRTRPIEVAALQALTPHRSCAWTRIAGGMADLITVVRSRDDDSGPERTLRRHIFERSQTVLHLGRDCFSSAPWRWLDDVAATGAVLVSEPLPPHPLLKNGVNYFEASAHRLPDLIDQLLNTTEGAVSAERAAASLRHAFAAHSDMERNGLEILRLLDAVQVGSS